MSDEIRRLGTLVGEFDYPFHPHSGFLRNYKKVSTIPKIYCFKYTVFNFVLKNPLDKQIYLDTDFFIVITGTSWLHRKWFRKEFKSTMLSSSS